MLTEQQQLRYARNIRLPQIGERGQEKLLKSKVLVVGAGGLGSPSSLYLAAAGVGTIGIIDDDRVELSNLQRQILHETGDIGRPKAESAKDALHDLNPDITIHALDTRLTEKNAHAIVAEYDIVADGCDNFATRFLLNEVCYTLEKPLISAAIAGTKGQLSTFNAYLDGQHPCYRCLVPELPPREGIPDCSELGIIGALAGIIGSWQAMEVIKELLGIGESLSGWLVRFDALTGESRKVRINPDRTCTLCGSSPERSVA